MRKNSVRKFIHAILDLLPLLIIPIFAININQKSVEPIQVEVQEKISVDFNQVYKRANVEYTAIKLGSVSVIMSQYAININGIVTDTNSSNVNTIFGYNNGANVLLPNHTYMFRCNLPNTIRLQQNYYNTNGVQEGASITYTNNSIKFTNYVQGQLNIYVVFTNYSMDLQYDNIVLYPNIFDLTEMNLEDITTDEFNALFTEDHYDYVESQKMLLNKPTTTIYNDTDIGSQFLYSLYIPVHDYFNFNNLFNMGAIYDWIQLNLFSGTAPLPVFIIWNIIVYEFFVDLIFLFYSVFMFIIDFAQKCLERPFGR